jgi:hypothetical protein
MQDLQNKVVAKLLSEVEKEKISADGIDSLTRLLGTINDCLNAEHHRSRMAEHYRVRMAECGLSNNEAEKKASDVRFEDIPEGIRVEDIPSISYSGYLEGLSKTVPGKEG